MSIRDKVRDDPRGALFEVMGDVTAGMLGVEGSGSHMQPMTHFPDADSGEIWFITSSDTDLVRSVGQGARAHYCVISKDHDLHACLSGTLTQSIDQAKLDELWSPVAGAWFHGGKDDPKVTLLRLSLLDGELWASTSSAMKFGFEIARANVVEDAEPDIGTHRVIRFGMAA